MGWKAEFNKAVLDFINDRYGVGAVEVLDVYDSAYAYENSLGYSDIDYTVEISYKTADGRIKLVTYEGRFNGLIDYLTDTDGETGK